MWTLTIQDGQPTVKGMSAMSEPVDITGDAEPRPRNALERVRAQIARLEENRLSPVTLLASPSLLPSVLFDGRPIQLCDEGRPDEAIGRNA